MTDLTRPCGHCGHAWNRHHFDTRAARAGIFCSRYSFGGDPCERGCPGFEETNEKTFLSEPDEFGDRSWVCAWTDGGGIEIEAPGCGTAQLNDAEAKVLLRFLIDRYGAEFGRLPRSGSRKKEAIMRDVDNPFALFDDTPERKAKVREATQAIRGAIEMAAQSDAHRNADLRTTFYDIVYPVMGQYREVGARDTMSRDLAYDALALLRGEQSSGG